MKDKLRYTEVLPTHGDHRPLWPKYGEYRCVCTLESGKRRQKSWAGGHSLPLRSVYFRTRPFLAAGYSPKIASIEENLVLETLIK